jgi:hypothetical protein
MNGLSTNAANREFPFRNGAPKNLVGEVLKRMPDLLNGGVNQMGHCLARLIYTDETYKTDPKNWPSINVCRSRRLGLDQTQASDMISKQLGLIYISNWYYLTVVIFSTLVGRCNSMGVLPVFTTTSPGFKKPRSFNISIWSCIISSSVISSP